MKNLNELANVLTSGKAKRVDAKSILQVVKDKKDLYLGTGRGFAPSGKVTVYVEFTDGTVYETKEMKRKVADKTYRKLNTVLGLVA